jgi:hypothetical protein
VCVDVALLVGRGIGLLGWVCFGGRGILARSVGLASLWTFSILEFGTGGAGRAYSVHMGLLIMVYADAGKDMQQFIMGSRDVHSFIWR